MNKKQMIKEQKRIKQERKEVATLFKDDKDVYNVFKIALGVILFLGLSFVIVNVARGNWNLFTKSNTQIESIDNNMVMVGTMFNKSDEEYLVLAYDLSSDTQMVYRYLKDSYEGSKKLYVLDLSSGFNKAYIGNTNVISNDLTKFKLSTPTLLVIKGDKIVASYKEENEIVKYLQK